MTKDFDLNDIIFRSDRTLKIKHSLTANEPKISKAKIAFEAERLFESELKK